MMNGSVPRHSRSILVRSFTASSNSRNNAQTKSLLNIQARPPGEAEIPDKFPLPDADKERQLSQLQVGVQDVYQRGNYRQALKLANDLLKDTEDHFDRDHPATASAYCNVGLVHKQLGEYPEAQAAYKHAQGIYSKVLGKQHASYAACLHNTAVLYQTMVHLDAGLRATDRWSLLEDALVMLQEALEIRKNELGHEHPHTVATQSTLGSLLASKVLHHYKVVVNNSRKDEGSSDGTNETSPSSSTPSSRLYTSLVTANNSVTAVSEETWEAAHTHLRQALETAIQHPRGPSIHGKGKQRTARKLKKSSPKSKLKVKPVVSNNTGPVELETLSSANAAQNLAIFLKARGMVLRGEETSPSRNLSTTSSPISTAEQLLQESHDWYRAVLTIRLQLLPKGHALIYATMYSLAECLEAMERVDEAQAIRQDIVDIYDPVEVDAPAAQETET